MGKSKGKSRDVVVSIKTAAFIKSFGQKKGLDAVRSFDALVEKATNRRARLSESSARARKAKAKRARKKTKTASKKRGSK